MAKTEMASCSVRDTSSEATSDAHNTGRPVRSAYRPVSSMHRSFLPSLTLLAALFAGNLIPGALARGIYQEPQDFLAETFGHQVPRPNVLWLTGEKRKQASKLLGHEPSFLRLRYWANEHKSAWILDETGKTEPITVGLVIADGKIRQLKVLVFRESRGSEVRHEFFTRQFRDARLDGNGRLDRPIDGISGATLSVRALTRLARLALYLDQQRPRHDAP